jgi:hypothetical protein
VAPEPARHQQRRLFLLLFAVRYQPAVIYAPQKFWQSCSAEWVRTAMMLAVTGCCSLFCCASDAHSSGFMHSLPPQVTTYNAKNARPLKKG